MQLEVAFFQLHNHSTCIIIPTSSISSAFHLYLLSIALLASFNCLTIYFHNSSRNIYVFYCFLTNSIKHLIFHIFIIVFTITSLYFFEIHFYFKLSLNSASFPNKFPKGFTKTFKDEENSVYYRNRKLKKWRLLCTYRKLWV